MEATLGKIAEICADSAIKIVFALIVLVVGFKLVKFVAGCMAKSRVLEKIDPAVRTFCLSTVKILLKIIIVISAAGILGVPMTSVITILGSAGVAIGLALQGSLSNIAGGLIILIFKPFTVGDFIDCADGAGTVSSIGIFYTKIITPDNKLIIVPNGTITNQSLTNATGCNERRVDFTFSVGYECDIEKVKAILISIAENHEKVKKDPAPLARLQKHGESSLDFVFRVWCKSEDYWDVYFDVEEQVKQEFDKNGISIPYPQMDVHMINTKTE